MAELSDETSKAEAIESKQRKRVVTVRMSPMLHSRLSACAKEAKRSINTVCTAAIEDYVMERITNEDPTELFRGDNPGA